MQKSQAELLALIAAVIASALALMLPVQYAWVTSICGFALLLMLFSYVGDADRSVVQSLAFASACGLGAMLLLDIYYRWLAGKGEIHMAGGRIETDWLPLTWLGGTLASWAIDRIRLGLGRSSAKLPGPVQRGFIPQYAEPIAQPAAASPQTIAVQTATQETRAAPPPPAAPRTPEPMPVLVQTPPKPPPPPPPVPQVEIYVALVGEGLNLMRTVRAEHVGRDFYKIVEEMPEDETWEFTPGQVVRVTKRKLSTGKGLVAVEEAPRAS
jgi:hypothetical protein